MSVTKKDLELFTQPLSVEEIDWVIQFNSKDTTNRTRVLPFASARTVESRLRNYIGWGNYKTTIKPINVGEVGTIHTISIFFKHENGREEWFSIDGVGEISNVSPLKGSASTSLKKACAIIGLGAELYDFPYIYLEGSQLKDIPKWGWKELKKLAANIIKVNQNNTQDTLEFTYLLRDSSASIILPTVTTPRPNFPAAARPVRP